MADNENDRIPERVVCICIGVLIGILLTVVIFTTTEPVPTLTEPVPPPRVNTLEC